MEKLKNRGTCQYCHSGLVAYRYQVGKQTVEALECPQCGAFYGNRVVEQWEITKAIQKQKGFTLVELLVVIVIISIITAGAIPNYLMLMKRSQKTSYTRDLRTIAGATGEFYNDLHGGFNPITGAWTDSSYPQPQRLMPDGLGNLSYHSLKASAEADPNHSDTQLLITAFGDATDTDIANHAIWFGLLSNRAGDGVSGGITDPYLAMPLTGDYDLYLVSVPASASSMNGGTKGTYTWVVGDNGHVYGAYKAIEDGRWYAGFYGAWP